MDQVQVYCPVDDEWTCHSLSHRLARLSCSLYNGRVYIIANNSNIVYRYCPQTNKLEDWLTLSSVGTNLEFAGLSAYNGQLFICGGQQEDNTLRFVSLEKYFSSFSRFSISQFLERTHIVENSLGPFFLTRINFSQFS